MNKVKEMLSALLRLIVRAVLVRKKIAVRFLFTLLFFAVWGIASLFIFFLTVFHYIWLFVSTRQSPAIRSLSNKISIYTYRMLRYITLNEAARPYPFSKFPEETEEAEIVDLSVELPEEPLPGSSRKGDGPAAQKGAGDETVREAVVSDPES